MNKQFINFTAGVVCVLVVFGTAFLLQRGPIQQSFSGVGGNPTIIGAATTSAAVSVTASTRVAATTTNPLGGSYTRVYTSICNPSATIVALLLNEDKPVTNGVATTFIGAAAGYNVCYEITDRNLYQGSIQASSTVGAVNVYVAQYVQ